MQGDPYLGYHQTCRISQVCLCLVEVVGRQFSHQGETVEQFKRFYCRTGMGSMNHCRESTEVKELSPGGDSSVAVTVVDQYFMNSVRMNNDHISQTTVRLQTC